MLKFQLKLLIKDIRKKLISKAVKDNTILQRDLTTIELVNDFVNSTLCNELYKTWFFNGAWLEKYT